MVLTSYLIVIFNDSCQGTKARKVNCGRVYSAYILKPVIFGRNLKTRIDLSVFVYYIQGG